MERKEFPGADNNEHKKTDSTCDSSGIFCAIAAVAADRSETTIFQANASPNNASTETSSLVGENAVLIASTKLAEMERKTCTDRVESLQWKS